MIRFLQTPGPLKKIILGGILLVICAAMVITLVPGGLGSNFGLGGPGEGVVATVGGQDVTRQEVLRTTDQMLRQQFPKAGAETSMLRPYFASRAAENLISQKALLAEAERLGLRATDEEVRDEIEHGRYSAAFFPGGKFVGEDEYEARLRSADLTVPLFEQSIKEQILFDKLRSLVTGGVAVSDPEVRSEFEKKNVKVKLEYAVLDRDEIMKGIHPTETELKAFYDSHKAAYTNAIPEKRKIRYVLTDASKLDAKTEVTQQDLARYYDDHREQYRVPEQVNVRHILIKVPLPGADGKVDQKGVDAAKKKAEDVLKQLKAGAKFEDLAKKYSEDPSSGENGGSLGWIQRGRTVPEFEKAAFSLPKGGTSDLIQSSYGFHIIRVDDKQEAHVKTLDEIRSEIEPIIKQQKLSQAAEVQANTLLSRAHSDGLDKAAAALGLQLINTDFIGRNDSLPGIGASPQFTDAVFSQPEKTPPQEVQVGPNYAVFEVLAVKPPATPAFDEIRSRVETEFKNDRATALLTQKTQELSDRAKAQHDLKKAAKELGATVKTSDFVAADGQVPDVGSMAGAAAVAFTMKPGEISGPIPNANNGVVLSVLERQEPSSQEFEGKKAEIRESLRESKEGEMFELFVANLREQMQKSGKIKINQQEMKTLTRAPGSEEGA